MGMTDKLSAKARERLTTSLGPDEAVLHSATVGPVGMVVTNRRVMFAPYNQLAGADNVLPLSAVTNVSWHKGALGSQGTLTIHTTAQPFTIKTPNKQGEPAAEAIRRAMAGVGA
jgi:hypothetical protein